MNALQKAVLALGISAFIGLGLYPPWTESLESPIPEFNTKNFVGFAPLIKPPAGHKSTVVMPGRSGEGRKKEEVTVQTVVRVNIKILAIEWAAVCVVTLILVGITSSRQSRQMID